MEEAMEQIRLVEGEAEEQAVEQFRPVEGEAEFECTVCCETLPATAFPDMEAEDDGIPIDCFLCVYDEDEDDGMKPVVCKTCLGKHFAYQFRALGAHKLSCIQPSCTEARWSRFERFGDSWTDVTHLYLPEDMKEAFNQELFTKYWAMAQQWTCPENCMQVGNTEGWMVLPADTPGYPHVQCPGCHKRFCAVCQVRWHDGMTCQDWRKENPDHKPTTAKQTSSAQPDADLKTMAQLGARFCPRCKFIIVKNGG
jgi:hypothetical protein